MRTAVVLGHGGGAFDIFVKLAKWFIGGSAGSGKQWMSWIHIEDLIRLFEWALKENGIEGPVNASAPEPLRNKDFMAALRKAYGRPWSPPTPALLIELYGKVGGPDPSLALDGYRVVPERALEEGFDFHYPTLKEALADLVSKR